MKILVGGLYHESNTFNPFLTEKDNFTLYEGEEMLNRVKSTQVFKDAGAIVIPTIHAFGISSGIVTKDTYRYFADKMLKVIKKEENIDGIWLHLHGSMTVQGIGSAELQLLKEIREIVGSKVPISLTLDPHANNTNELMNYANIVRAYRTVPHVDQEETEIITAKNLVEIINNNELVNPSFIRLPMIIGGETALGRLDPLKSIYDKIEEIEKNKEILTASFFIGFSWADTENSAPSVTVVPTSSVFSKIADTKAKELSDYIYSKREEFDFGATVLQPKAAIETAIKSPSKPVFITDSGDNTTGGAVGTYTVLLEILLNVDTKDKKICVAGIFDKEAFEVCNKHEIGEKVELNIGTGEDEYSKKLAVKGVLKTKGDLMGYLGATNDKAGEVCTINLGNIDLVIANSSESFITLGHFNKADLNIEEYDIIVVKQGYLFDELSKIAEEEILALTPGATYQIIEELNFKNIPRPVYPLDK
uniref:M81 family metallopeptidase n=1 Tax=Staphylococcus sp. LKG8-2 TaxID=3399689 RepID=UPI003BF5B202